MKVSFLITGYNCQRYVKACLDSVFAQTYKDIEVIVYNDASKDRTATLVARYPGVKLINSKVNRGALYGRIEMAKIATGDIVFILGLDDAVTKHAAKIVVDKYRAGAKMTYGSWKDMGGADYIAGEYPDHVWENRSFRRSKWIATAPQTFLRSLVLDVPDNVLKHGGEYFKNCTDLALTFPILEVLKKEEVAVIKTPIYLYRSQRSGNTIQRLGKENKTAIREILRRMPPIPRS